MVAVRNTSVVSSSTDVVWARPDCGLDCKRASGFTLVEVMIAMLIGTIGLLGTLAVLQTIISSSKNANDSAIAMRLATQKLDELGSRNTDTQAADNLMGLAPLAQWANWWPRDASGTSPVPEYVNAEGICFCETDGTPKVPLAADLGLYRWRRQWRVVDLNPGPTDLGYPYVVSVIVSFTNDVGDTRTTRVDLERSKAW
jgi:prepilin-type N-terminal cleavage/methylation domain-containing protein